MTHTWHLAHTFRKTVSETRNKNNHLFVADKKTPRITGCWEEERNGSFTFAGSAEGWLGVLRAVRSIVWSRRQCLRVGLGRGSRCGPLAWGAPLPVPLPSAPHFRPSTFFVSGTGLPECHCRRVESSQEGKTTAKPTTACGYFAVRFASLFSLSPYFPLLFNVFPSFLYFTALHFCCQLF